MVNNADTKVIASPSVPNQARDGFPAAYGPVAPDSREHWLWCPVARALRGVLTVTDSKTNPRGT